MVDSRNRVDSGIWSTQVGDPLADGREGVAHRSSSDSLTVLTTASVSESVDEEAGEFLFGVGNITEGDVVAVAFAELFPMPHDAGLSLPRFRGGGSSGESKRSAEIRGETTSCGSWTSRHGFACG